MYTDLRDDNPVFSDLVAHNAGSRRGTWVQGDVVRHLELMYVSANYFSALGVAPAYGRTFLPEEERYGAEPVVVLSYQMWQQQGADPRIVGQYANINARALPDRRRSAAGIHRYGRRRSGSLVAPGGFTALSITTMRRGRPEGDRRSGTTRR